MYFGLIVFVVISTIFVGVASVMSNIMVSAGLGLILVASGIYLLSRFRAEIEEAKDALKKEQPLKNTNFLHEVVEVVSNNKTSASSNDNVAIVCEEIIDVLNKAKNGFFAYKITTTPVSDDVAKVTRATNELIDAIQSKLERVIDVLVKYGESHFDARISDHDGLTGSFGSLAASSSLIGNNVSELMALLNTNGNKLLNETKYLTDESHNLSLASNRQAASLEETAAAIEEITANVSHNTESVSQMTTLAQSVTKAANDGKQFAEQTAKSMDSINSEVSAIHEAVTIIDQIAFQTNILSLNAAVEAATAGEAGKGFAVVAQEVRNLATRSAEAAKEIKRLVENATNKSNDGKKIAGSMINGYNDLTLKINETIEIIENVSMASKEQEAGLHQINDAVAALDQLTQQNAATAEQISQLSQIVMNLAQNMIDSASHATYSSYASKGVCDVELMFKTAKLKNDHIAFKENNFKKLGKFQKFEVTNHHNCNLGKWMDDMVAKNMPFTKTSAWSHLDAEHQKVHAGVQSFISKDSEHVNFGELVNIAKQIEDSTHMVFRGLNEVKAEHCSRN